MGVVQQLHQLERKLLPLLPRFSSVPDLIKESGLKEVEVTRALQWLKNKELVQLQEAGQELLLLDKNGKSYLASGLPERRLLDALSKVDVLLSDIPAKAKIDKAEVSISLGALKKRAAIDIKKNVVSLTPPGKMLLRKELLEEQLLKRQFPLLLSELSPEERFAATTLLNRKQILKKELVKKKQAFLTALGEELIKENLESDVLDAVTIEVLKNRLWKEKSFRAYDVKTPVPKSTYGKVHFEQQAISAVKSIFLEMGFSEVRGNIVQTAFWDLDSLFVPQDHPAREMQDTFYVEGQGKLPKELAKKIQATHEKGGDTGSKGWGGQWSEETAKQLLLRTHSTGLSAQTIARLSQKDLPAKVFSVSKVFRNEAADWKHLFEFYQVEGIVVDEHANFRQLLFYLRQFYKKMGYDNIRIRPAHFPYTEPSVEIEAFIPEKKEWVELGGAGIFRPEVVKPLLGKDVPVLAWGLGLARIIAPYYNITDLREMYKNDIKQLRDMKAWLQC